MTIEEDETGRRFPRATSELLAEAIGEADEAALRATQILANALPLSTSDHAAGWALVAIHAELRAWRVIATEQLGTLRDHVERAVTEQTGRGTRSPTTGRSRGSW